LIALGPCCTPQPFRSTGVGWAMGLGRFGSIVGPLALEMSAL
jgi:AAHS family 4-hydroxybenzoate transporter-like MFS transporter